jgi:TonB-dependent starch-binding outer membrane protein SusC
MKKLNLILRRAAVLLFVMVAATAWSQTRTVTGVVKDATGPIPSVSILEKGTTNGAITDLDGKFSLAVGSNATLIISFVGYTTQEVAIGTQNVFNITLAEDSKTLGEVVVVGYGTQKKKDLTGSIVSISERNFQKGNITTAEQLVAGKIAGVSITSNGGAPGSGGRIRIRGGSSLSADDPLIVVDGVPLAGGGEAGSATAGIGGVANGLSLINPNDIESITVLKDASAAAIYGSRASNGVIMVVTKKGKKGDKLNVNFSSVLSNAQATGFVPVLTGDQFRALVTEKGNSSQKLLLGKENTNWQEQIYRNAFSHDENLSFTGSVSSLPYRVSVGYLDQNGILLGSNMNRKSASVNLSPRLLDDHLKIDVSYKGSFNKSTFADEGAIGAAVSFDPTQPIRTEKNRFQGYYEWLDNSGNLSTLAGRNPLGLLNSQQDISDVNRHIANAIFDYKFHFLPELRINANVAIDQANTEGYKIRDSTAGSAFIAKGVNNIYSQTRTNKTFESYLNYVKDFSGFRVDVMAGYGYQDFLFEGIQNDRDQNGKLTGDTIPSIVRPKGQSTLVSFFGRANLGFKDRYLATVTLRRDGSSKLAPGYKWITYPAAALAWRMSEDGIGKGIFSDLKLRLGYGITGQQDGISDYNGLKRFSLSGNTAQYALGNEYISTIRPEGFNELLTWQQTASSNFGIDFTTKNERISGAIDYYFRETSNLFNDVNIPAGSNFTNRLRSNIGTLQSNGVELTLNTTPVKTSSLTWEANFIIAYNTNKITKLNIVDDPKYIGVETGGISGGVGNNIQLHGVGYPKSSFYVYKQVYAENGKPIEGVYVDRNGDGKITVDDKYIYEKPDPNVTLGFTSNLSLGDFSFGFVLRGSVGNYVYSNVNSGGTFGSNSLGYLYNPSPNVLETGFTNAQYFSDYYIQNASFLKMDNLSLGYNLSSLFKNKVRAQLSAIVQNVFTVTKYTGIDPEKGDGIDNNIYLRPRTISLGINVNF